MRQLSAPTEEFIKLAQSVLTADVAAGNNMTLVLENNTGFNENDFVVIGEIGNETAELQQVNQTVSAGSDIQVQTLVRSHKKGEVVTVLRFDKRKFYGCETVDGTFVELTGDGSPKAISVDNPTGTVLEYSGDTYSYFKATYYNSADLSETAIEDSIAVAGDTSSRYTTLYRIRQKAGVVGNPFLSDSLIEEYRQEAESEVNGYLSRRYAIPLTTIPKVIRNITTKLAAGYLHESEFAPEATGEKWTKEAREHLLQIQKGQVELLDDTGAVLAERSTNSPVGYPDSTLDSNTSEKPKFTIGQKF